MLVQIGLTDDGQFFACRLKTTRHRSYRQIQPCFAVQKILPRGHGLHAQLLLLQESQHGFTPPQALGTEQYFALECGLKLLQGLQRLLFAAVYCHHRQIEIMALWTQHNVGQRF